VLTAYRRVIAEACRILRCQACHEERLVKKSRYDVQGQPGTSHVGRDEVPRGPWRVTLHGPYIVSHNMETVTQPHTTRERPGTPAEKGHRGYGREHPMLSVHQDVLW